MCRGGKGGRGVLVQILEMWHLAEGLLRLWVGLYALLFRWRLKNYIRVLWRGQNLSAWSRVFAKRSVSAAEFSDELLPGGGQLDCQNS